MKYILIIALFAGLKPAGTIADKIIEYAQQQMGKKVSRGECWDLAEGALNYAGAKWEPPFGFGTKINYKKEALKPADILQFTDVTFALPYGTMSFPQHTAIVYKANQNKVTVFQQNFNRKRYVDTLTIDLGWMKKGTLEAFRAIGN